MEGEYRITCSLCRKRGKGDLKNMFARIYYRKINNEWVWLCKDCWEKQLNK